VDLTEVRVEEVVEEKVEESEYRTVG